MSDQELRVEMDKNQTEVFDKFGVFFAFSNEQLKEQSKPEIEYVSLGGGMIGPKHNVAEFAEALNKVHSDYYKADLEKNGKKKIIHRELANYETQYTGDITDTVDALDSYGITREEVQAEFNEYMQYCNDNDLF